MNRALSATWLAWALLLAACFEGDGAKDAGADPADYAACSVPSDCMVASESCCGTCGAPTHGDAVAVAANRAAAYRGAVCEGSSGCPACAPLFIDPTLVATCRDHRCALVDLREHEASDCSADADCHVRTPDCCPCNGDTSLGRLIGVSSEDAYESLVCDPDQACDECGAVYPDEVTVRCNADDHCETHDARLPFSTSASLAGCEVSGVLYPSGSDGIDDPVSCNTCNCYDGSLACTDIACPEECPSGTRFGIDCARCGPVDNCEVVRTSCLPGCQRDQDCDQGTCDDGACVTRCG